MRNASFGVAVSVNDSGGVTIRSGVPSSQPSGNVGSVGVSAAFPSGVPAATHDSIIDSSVSVSTRCPSKRPMPGSTFQGGMKRRFVTCTICVARCRTSR